MATATIAALLATLVAATGLAGAALADGGSGGDRMTICHVPPGNPSQAQTKEIPRSAWDGHRGHGDHEGACTGREGSARPAPPPPPPRPPVPPPRPTQLGVTLEAAGELDGDAAFRARVQNRGDAPALRVVVTAGLGGDGRWTVESPATLCQAEAGRLRCELGDLPAGSGLTVKLAYDGDPAVCRAVAVDLRVAADNDSSSGDDRARESARVGACSPLDEP